MSFFIKTYFNGVNLSNQCRNNRKKCISHGICLFLGIFGIFRGWWRHQMTPNFQKRWNLPKIVKINLKTFEKRYNTANLNDFWFSWLWRHNDVTVAKIEVASNGFRFRISSGIIMPNIKHVPKKFRIALIIDSTITIDVMMLS